MVTISTPIKPKGRQAKKSPLYFKRRRRNRVKQGKPQPSSTSPITIEGLVSHQEGELDKDNKQTEEITSLKAKGKKLQASQTKPSTREAKTKQLKEESSML